MYLSIAELCHHTPLIRVEFSMFQFHSQHFSMFLVFAKKKYLKTLDWEFVHTKQEFCFWLLSSVDICITNFFQICEGFFGAFNFTNCFCYKLIKKQTRLQTIFQRLLQKRKNLLQPILHLHLQFFPKIVLDLTLVHWIIHLHLKKRTSTMNPRSWSKMITMHEQGKIWLI